MQASLVGCLRVTISIHHIATRMRAAVNQLSWLPRHLHARGVMINGSLGGETAVQWGTHSVLRLSPCQKTF